MISREYPVRNRLRWSVLLVAIYFAACWLLLAESNVVEGAVTVAVLAFAMAPVALWARKRHPQTTPGVLPPEVEATQRASIQDVIDTHSADPEAPARRRARFLGALGHELRNPLNSVTGFSDMLLGRVDGDLNDEQIRSVRTIRASAERLLRLVSTVVDRAKLEAIAKGVKKDKKVQIIGFGTFEVKKRAARMGRNPKTGEAMKINASKSVGFKPSSVLKKSL